MNYVDIAIAVEILDGDPDRTAFTDFIFAAFSAFAVHDQISLRWKYLHAAAFAGTAGPCLPVKARNFAQPPLMRVVLAMLPAALRTCFQ